MGGTISKDVGNERWIREPSLITIRRYSDPSDIPDGQPIPVLRRRRSQPLKPWLDEAVEIIVPPKRSASAPPASTSARGGGPSRGGGLHGLIASLAPKPKSPEEIRAAEAKKAEKALREQRRREEVRERQNRIAERKAKQKAEAAAEKAKLAAARPVAAPPPIFPPPPPLLSQYNAGPSVPPAKPTAPTTTEDDSEYTESESESSEPEPAPPPPPPPEPVYSFANPRISKYGAGPVAGPPKASGNPYRAATSAAGGGGGAIAKPAEPYSFSNPRMSTFVRNVPKTTTVSAAAAAAKNTSGESSGETSDEKPLPRMSAREGAFGAPPALMGFGGGAAARPKPKTVLQDNFWINSGSGAAAGGSAVVQERRPNTKNMEDLLGLGDDFSSWGMGGLGGFGGAGALGGAGMAAGSSAAARPNNTKKKGRK